MDRKFSFTRLARSIHLINWLIFISLCSTTAFSASSNKTITAIESYFSDINSALSTLGQDVASSNTKKAKEPMEKTLKDHPGVLTILRLNSKGKVINEAVREGKPGKPNRNLSQQRWFKKIKNLEPHYGSLKTRKGDHLLFWCIPIRITKSGKDRCGGAIVARIDLKRSFDAISKKMDASFRILQKGESLFSYSWDTSYDTTALALNIKGLTDLQINVKEKAAAPPKTTEKKKRSSKINIKTIILFIVIAIVLVLLWSIFNYVTKKKQEALIRRIEGEEPDIKTSKSPDIPEENTIKQKVKIEEETLPDRREEDVHIKSEEEIPSEESTKVTQKMEVLNSEKTKEAMPEIPAKEETSRLDAVPEETVRIRPELIKSIWDENPEDKKNELPEVTAEEEKESASSNIMEEIEPLLQKHLKAVLSDRMKQIEEDVLARVKDELAGRMNNTE